ncbi:MAG: dephospho-CoA kinase [Deferribacteraceae bacterium]|jgi:dephospho-CoA kinase|nr:dephospho-CoA kinase [Deferribacteraceae bacterium]
MKIGLTGGIATGKNFVATLFADKGCYTLDADEVSRIVMRSDGAAYPHIVESFGESILATDGEIDRASLRKVVSSDIDKLHHLESIVHPAVAKYSDKFYRSIKGRDDKAIFVHHAPMLLEAGGASFYDVIVLIYCPKEVQLERLQKRGYPPYEDAIRLMNRQWSYEEKLKYAHHIIDNSGLMEETKAEVERVYNIIKLMRRAK